MARLEPGDEAEVLAAADGGDGVRLLLFAAPGGHERFFEGLAGLMARGATWPPGDAKKLCALQREHER